VVPEGAIMLADKAYGAKTLRCLIALGKDRVADIGMVKI